MAAKKWIDNGTTGFELSPKDIDKLCEEASAKLDKARTAKMLAQYRYETNQHQIWLIHRNRSQQKRVLHKRKSMNRKLYEKFQKANSKYIDAQQEHALFLHRLVRDHMHEDEQGDIGSLSGSDVTVPMSPNSLEDGAASLDGECITDDDGVGSELTI